MPHAIALMALLGVAFVAVAFTLGGTTVGLMALFCVVVGTFFGGITVWMGVVSRRRDAEARARRDAADIPPRREEA